MLSISYIKDGLSFEIIISDVFIQFIQTFKQTEKKTESISAYWLSIF